MTSEQTVFRVAPADPLLEGLFDQDGPNRPILQAMLYSRNPGLAVVDTPTRPRQCVARSDGLFAFASQRATPGFLRRAVALLREVGEVALVQADGGCADAPEPSLVVPRTEFSQLLLTSPRIEEIKNGKPRDLHIAKLDAQLLERCAWRGEMERFCGSAQRFLDTGFGLCLLLGNEIVSEAYAAFVGAGTVEIGAITAEAHRMHGYASVVTAFLVDECRKQGLSPHWSCGTDNLGSMRVAGAFPFRRRRPYRLLLYSAVSNGVPESRPAPDLGAEKEVQGMAQSSLDRDLAG
jgi:hypothetical protein